MQIERMAGAAAVLGLSILLAACGQPSSPAPETPETLQTLQFPVPNKRPAIESFYGPVLEQLDRDMQQYVQDGKVASLSYVLLKDGERVQSGFHGSRILNGQESVDEHTIYRIYSMTKIVTAVSLLMLYEEGKFSMDDPITRFLPELDHLTVVRSFAAADGTGVHPVSRPPTMRELLTHTAGFAYGDGRQDYANRLFLSRRVAEAETNEEYLKRVASVPLMYEPGTAWAYSAASDLQGIIVERISGKRLGEFMKARIFDPLGMVDTGFSVDKAKRNRLAAFTAWTPDRPMTEIGGALASMDRNSVRRDAGGYGLVSTIADYERFALMLLHNGSLDGETLLRPETVGMLRENGVHFVSTESGLPIYESSRGAGFGFGAGVVTNTIRSGLGAPEGTYFWDGASGTWFWVDPRHDIVFIGMVQNFSASPVMPRRRAMQDVYHALFSDYFPSQPNIPADFEN